MYAINRDYLIGNFRDMRRAAAGARLFEQVVKTGLSCCAWLEETGPENCRQVGFWIRRM